MVQKGMTGANGNVYCGLHEFNDMAFVMHLLRPGDLFVDVGANVGSYTVLASGHAGADCISIEPIPETFNQLKRNIAINGLEEKVAAMQAGMGSSERKLKFTAGYDTVNHVVGNDESVANTIEVPVKTADSILKDKQPILIKIDVEGFETEVLKGATQTLANPTLNAVIVELNGSGIRYGYSDDNIHQFMVRNGFSPYAYSPYTRTLVLLETHGDTNTIYLRDKDFVKERLKSAESFVLFGIMI